MKKVIAVKGARVCNTELGGCGRTIKQGEVCYRQKRSRAKKGKTRYLCKDCWEKLP